MKKITTKAYLLPFILITSLFFFWGFIHNLDPILIPHLRKAFRLTDTESALVDSSVFIAYFLMALPAGFIMRRYGYKAGIMIGLILFAIGSVLFVPAANTLQYAFFLGALFVIACGITFLETAANPYITILGPKKTATQRLNFSQSFNGLAAYIAPTFIGPLILSGTVLSDADMKAMDPAALQQYLAGEAASVKMPYLILGLIIAAVAVILFFTKLPDIKHEEDSEKAGASFSGALQSKRLRWAVVAQFFYVGAQVCVASFFIKMGTDAAMIPEKKAAKFLGYYGLAFMLGRFAGTFLMQWIAPAKLLGIFAMLSVVLTFVAIGSSGMTVLYALIATAFFMSIMFPTIFSLGIEGLGIHTKIGASLLIMSIVGGAFLPLVTGKISDITGNIQYGYYVPVVCFGVILAFAYYNMKGAKRVNA